MRYLILFMILAGIFVLGRNNFIHWSFGGVRGEGPLRTETRNTGDFHAISVEVPADVEVSVSENYLVEIQAQENLLPLLQTEVQDGKLRFYFDENVSHVKDLKIRISAPRFDGLAIAGSGSIKALTPIVGDRLTLSIGGSGSINLPQADIGNMECEIAGSGDIHVSGKAGDIKFSIAGSGDIDAKGLETQTAHAEIAGSGAVTCHPIQTLKASIAGSGDVFYVGSPAVEMDVSGSGKVKKVE